MAPTHRPVTDSGGSNSKIQDKTYSRCVQLSELLEMCDEGPSAAMPIWISNVKRKSENSINLE